MSRLAALRAAFRRVVEATRPTSSTDVDGYPLPGRGLLHALGIVTALLVPVSFAIGAQAATAIEGFPLVTLVAVTVLAGVTGAVLSVVRPLPGAAEILARLGCAIVVAAAIRFAFPTPPAAWAAYRAGETRLLTGTFWVAVLLVVTAGALGHGLTTAVGWLATRAPTREAAQERARRALLIWWVAVLVVVLADAATAGGLLGNTLVVAGGMVSLLLLVDLRLRTPTPPGTDEPIVVSSPRIAWATVTAVMAGAMVLGVLVLPLMPFGALGSVITPAWFDWLHTEETRRTLLDGWTNRLWSPSGQPGGSGGRMTPADVPLSGRIVSLLLLVVLMAIIRPHGFRAMLRRLRRRVRRTRPDAVFGDLSPSDVPSIDDEGRSGGRLRALVDRLRGRPRDARSAVLHHYRQVERLLERDEQARAAHETPHEHAVRVHVSDDHEQLADLAADARFSRRPPDDATVDLARELRRRVERTLRDRR